MKLIGVQNGGLVVALCANGFQRSNSTLGVSIRCLKWQTRWRRNGSLETPEWVECALAKRPEPWQISFDRERTCLVFGDLEL